MKKIFSLVFIVGIVLSGVALADSVRDDALGNPVLNTEDTAIMKKYPAALQQFPNSVYAVFDTAAPAFYKDFGVLYKGSDLFGVKIAYENVPSLINQKFYVDGTLSATKIMAQVSSVNYGLKMGSLFAGLSAKTYFYDNQIINTVVLKTNAKEVTNKGISGFSTTFTPSTIIDLGICNLYATVDTSLNFTKMYTISSNKKDKWYSWNSPSLLNDIKLNLLAVKKVNDKTDLGVEAIFEYRDDGYSYQSVTNGVEYYKTNSYQGGMVSGSLAVAARLKPADSLLLFTDLGSSYSLTTAVHKKDSSQTNYNVTSVWSVPSLNMGAELELIKDLKVRISAKPTYSITTVKRASYDTITGVRSYNTTVSAFDVASTMGLGYKIGSFSINWTLNANLLSTLLNDPQQFIDINGSGVNVPLSTKVQVNYLF